MTNICSNFQSKTSFLITPNINSKILFIPAPTFDQDNKEVPQKPKNRFVSMSPATWLGLGSNPCKVHTILGGVHPLWHGITWTLPRRDIKFTPLLRHFFFFLSSSYFCTPWRRRAGAQGRERDWLRSAEYWRAWENIDSWAPFFFLTLLEKCCFRGDAAVVLLFLWERAWVCVFTLGATTPSTSDHLNLHRRVFDLTTLLIRGVLQHVRSP